MIMAEIGSEGDVLPSLNHEDTKARRHENFVSLWVFDLMIKAHSGFARAANCKHLLPAAHGAANPKSEIRNPKSEGCDG
jgi:hypothetical protein